MKRLQILTWKYEESLIVFKIRVCFFALQGHLKKKKKLACFKLPQGLRVYYRKEKEKGPQRFTTATFSCRKIRDVKNIFFCSDMASLLHQATRVQAPLQNIFYSFHCPLFGMRTENVWKTTTLVKWWDVLFIIIFAVYKSIIIKTDYRIYEKYE